MAEEIKPRFGGATGSTCGIDSIGKKRLQQLFDRYPTFARPDVQASTLTAGPSAGFSGGSVYCATAPVGKCAVRRWPPNFPQDRIQGIHDLIRAIGGEALSVPFATMAGETVVSIDGGFWDISPWLPGAPMEANNASDTMLASAARLLGSFHRKATAAARDRWYQCMTMDEWLAVRAGSVVSSSELERRRREWVRLKERIGLTKEARAGDALLDELGKRTVEQSARFEREMDRIFALSFPPVKATLCLRDVHRDHVLFEEERATGLIDYGAIGVGSLAADLGRYLGSVAADRQDLWQGAFEAYRLAHSLNAAEQRLAVILDATGTLIGALHWYEWLILDGRFQDCRHRAMVRWQTLLSRIERWSRLPTSL